ncbi:MAG: DUF4157 domain-containing protein [Proteobacteria bacterium]|nr:DUF4157 domain-containing protein [Pseudomonadota bacterium]
MKPFERLLRGQNDGRVRDSGDDIEELARAFGIEDPAIVNSLFDRAYDRARLGNGSFDAEYKRLLVEAAHFRPAPGKRTRTAALYGDSTRWAAPTPGVSPGKRTRTIPLAEEIEKHRASEEAQRQTEENSHNGAETPAAALFPGHEFVMSVMGTSADERKTATDEPLEIAYDELREGFRPPPLSPEEGMNRDLSLAMGFTVKGIEAWEHERNDGVPLPSATRQQMERTFGENFADVRLHQDSSEASGSIHAVTKGRDIHFARARFQPGTQEGDWLIGHELAHVVQQRRAANANAGEVGDHRELEADADRAATQALLGQQAVVNMRAPLGAAYAYSDAEPHNREQTPRPETSPEASDDMEPGPAQAEALDGNDGQPDVADNDAASFATSESQSAAQRDEQDQGTVAQTAADGGEHRGQRGNDPATDGRTGRGTDTAADVNGHGAGSGEQAAAQAQAPAISAESPGGILDALAQTSASRAINAYNQAYTVSPQALASQRAQAEQLPQIPTPRGLPANGTANARSGQATGPAQTQAPDPLQPAPDMGASASTAQELVSEAPQAPAPAPTELAGSDRASDTTEDGQPANDPALARSAQGALNQISAPMGNVRTAASYVPGVELTGAADPGQLQTALQTSSQATRAAVAEETQATQQEVGEHAIFPAPDDEVLTASQTLREVGAAQAEGAVPLVLPGEAMASIDAQASQIVQGGGD